ncbi:hypothetical protein PN36_00230 [Candidatus Thiomargarita nelsonii]|uniref:Uncharacterized protein n=1 Tax=Candidatus Thiomargarita nelsonii TaxID=1003181 RepID=A0A0A6SAK5_9GAMM|nr:hypothetical protein PN36_00230 [Candidatus Thiomargarita nelsonii]
MPEIDALIAPYIQEKEEKIFVGVAPDDRSIRRTFGGMNEFMSALVMNRIKSLKAFSWKKSY